VGTPAWLATLSETASFTLGSSTKASSDAASLPCRTRTNEPTMLVSWMMLVCVVVREVNVNVKVEVIEIEVSELTLDVVTLDVVSLVVLSSVVVVGVVVVGRVVIVVDLVVVVDGGGAGALVGMKGKGLS
jgi:hypothetical protein